MCKECIVDKCHREQYAKELCTRHRKQLRLYGKILERTRFDPNEYVIEGDICKIKLYNMKNKCVAETIIDTEDLDKVKNKKWYLSRYYVQTKKEKGVSAYLHHEIMGEPPEGFEIDHKHGNKLDNRKSKLRICTRSQNAHNMTVTKRSQSGYKGVYPRKFKWIAQIAKNKKTTHIGTFSTPKEAAMAYNEAAKKFHGKFARLNEI